MSIKEQRLKVLLNNAITIIIVETCSAYSRNLDSDWVKWLESQMGCTVEELVELGIDIR